MDSTLKFHERFSDAEYSFAILFAVVRTTNILCNAAMLLVVFFKRETLQWDINLLLTLHLSATEVIFAAPLAVIDVIKVGTRDWSTLGQLGCDIDGVFAVAGSLWSVIAILWIALERYLVIVKNRMQVSGDIWVAILVSGWMFVTLVCAIPFFVKSGYTLQPSKLYCALNWMSHDAVQLIPIGVGLSLLVVVCLALGNIYQSILQSVRQVKRVIKAVESVNTQFESSAPIKAEKSRGALTKSTATGAMLNGIAAPHKSGRMGELQGIERLIVLKGVSLTGTFATCWGPYSLNIVLALAGVHVPSWFDMVAASAAATFGIFSCLLSVIMDNKIRKAVMEVVKDLHLCYRQLASYFTKS